MVLFGGFGSPSSVFIRDQTHSLFHKLTRKVFSRFFLWIKSIFTWLLGRANPDGELLRSLHVDVLVEDVGDPPPLAAVSAPELHVDSFPGVRHVAVPEGDVVHVARPDGADGQSHPAGRYTFKQHVLWVVLNTSGQLSSRVAIKKEKIKDEWKFPYLDPPNP